jgi:aminomethyltransferase
LEAGYRLYGSDMDESTNPYEAGLAWTVKLQKGDFVGRDALTRVKEQGAQKVTRGVRCDGKAIPRHGARVISGDQTVGEVTSGTYSFFLSAGIGMVRVKRETQAGERVEIDMRGQRASGELVELPFHRGSVKSPTPIKAQA